MHLITQPAHVLPYSNSAMKGNNGTKRILYHDIAAQTITDPPVFYCWNQVSRIVGFLVCSPNVNSSLLYLYLYIQYIFVLFTVLKVDRRCPIFNFTVSIIILFRCDSMVLISISVVRMAIHVGASSHACDIFS
jgi:hypothetical protein